MARVSLTRFKTSSDRKPFSMAALSSSFPTDAEAA